MNIKHIVLGFFAAAAVLVGCQPKEEDFGVAKIEVSTTSLTFGPASGSQTLQVTASREWTVAGLPDWIAVDPAGAGPSKSPQTVTLTVIANDGYDREADIAFSIGLMKEYVKVSQTGQKGQIDYGKGTLEHPFSVDGVISYINALDNPSSDSPEKVYVKGIISAIGEEYTAQYGNGTFDISDDGTTSGTQFKVYRAKYLGNKNFTSKDTQIKVGDEVIVYGNVVLYGSSAPVYETSQGNAYLYSLNGVTGSATPAGDPKGNGSKDDPFNVAAALKVVEGLSWTSNDNYEKVGPFYVKGKVSQFGKDRDTGEDQTYTQSGTYGNATFYISDDGTTDNEFYCYRILYLGNKKFVAGQTDVKVGDEVIIYGELMNYRGNTPETVQGTAYLYSLNGETSGGEATETDHGATTVANFLAASESTSDWYELTGTISGLKNDDQYGNFNLTDDSGTIYVYGVLSEKGGEKKKFQELVSKYGIANGGTITIKANRGSYTNSDGIVKDEAVNAYFISYTGGDTPPSTETDHGATTVASFLAASESTTDWYELTGTISNLKEGDKYGNFDLTDDSGSVYVYGVLSTKGGEKQKFQELVSQYGIDNGGTITIKANRGSFQDKIEAVNAYFVSYNGQGGGQGGDDTTPTDIASIIAAADDASVAAENVYVGAVTTKGYVATDGKNSIYVYENASPSVKIGDVVKFSGTKTTYYGLPEITSPKTTKTSTATVPYPDPVDITANFDKYTASEAVYVKYKAKMFKSGNYTNFKVDGADLTGALSSAPTAYYNGINEGDEVVIYGYYNGINTNNHLLNVIAVKIENLTTGETIPSEGGQETKGITLTFPDENKESNGVSAYNKSWSARVGSMTWTVDGFNNNSWKNDWTYIKCGSKNFESVATISTDKAIDYKVIKVVVTLDKCTSDKIKSTKLLVARDSEFKDVIETVSQNISSGDMTYNVSSPAAGLFYRLEYDCEQGSANGLIQLSKVVYSE